MANYSLSTISTLRKHHPLQWCPCPLSTLIPESVVYHSVVNLTYLLPYTLYVWSESFQQRSQTPRNWGSIELDSSNTKDLEERLPLLSHRSQILVRLNHNYLESTLKIWILESEYLSHGLRSIYINSYTFPVSKFSKIWNDCFKIEIGTQRRWSSSRGQIMKNFRDFILRGAGLDLSLISNQSGL